MKKKQGLFSKLLEEMNSQRRQSESAEEEEPASVRKRKSTMTVDEKSRDGDGQGAKLVQKEQVMMGRVSIFHFYKNLSKIS